MIRNLIRGKGSLPQLGDLTPLLMLIEIGFEKIKKDYIHIFQGRCFLPCLSYSRHIFSSVLLLSVFIEIHLCTSRLFSGITFNIVISKIKLLSYTLCLSCKYIQMKEIFIIKYKLGSNKGQILFFPIILEISNFVLYPNYGSASQSNFKLKILQKN